MPTISLRGVHINFPFDPYACQEAYMDKVLESLQTSQNAVLESPTGTGKTLCLLCASLAWLQGRKAQTALNRQIHISSFVEQGSVRPENVNSLVKSLEASTGQTWGGAEFAVPKIIYASRTHSQLSQAVNELKRTAYNSMKVSVIGSREQLCIHEQVKKELSNTNKVHMCRAKVNARTCFYYNKFDDIKRNSDARQLVGTVVDIEDMVGYGEKNKVCPYYLAKELKNDAEIIFMPYNYLLDAKSRKAHGVELQGNIVIFDEAHNLEKICEESSSFDLTTADLATAIEEVCRLADKFVEMAQAEAQSLVEMTESSMPEPEFNLEDLLRMKSTLKELEDNLDSLDIGTGSNGVTHPGMFMFEFLTKVNIGFETKNFFIDILDKMINYLTSDTSSGFTTKAAGLSKIADVFKIVFSRETRLGDSLHSHQQTIAKYYKVHIQETKTDKKFGKKADLWSKAAEKQGRTLSYWCFSPGHSMLDLVAHGVKNVILTSGTLSPINSFTAEMQIPFPLRLENPHVIEKHQVWIGTMQKGPDGVVLNSNYETRFKPSYMSSLGNVIVNFARVVPNGMLVFFPSYPVMEKCLEHWQENNIYNRITQYKSIFVEPRGKVALYEAMEGFYEKINDPSLNGAIFIAVCRGKVSEGLDFSDINGRAVIITGLPYPPRMDPKVKLKMEFLDEMKGKQTFQTLTGNDWYKQQASRAVNQAIGRVIRHRHDYGAIILCDTRFSYQNSVNQLPIWVRPNVNKYSSFGQSLKDIMVFFKTAEKTLPAPQPLKKKQSTTGCHGAHFAPTMSRSKIVPKLEQARKVEQHVRSLRNTEEENALLQSQYEYTRQSVVKNKRHSLLGALSESEKFDTDVLDDSFDTGFAFNKPVTSKAKIPVKKKIIIKKRETSPKHSTHQILCVQDIDKKSSTTTLPLTAGHGETVTQTSNPTHLQTAEAYIAQVKRVLGPASYKLYTKAMVDYKQSNNFDNLTSILTNIFLEDAVHMDLLRRFYVYVRPHHRRQFHELCCNLTGEGCGFKPEHAISKKRVQTEISDGASKRQKTNTVSSTGLGQNDTACIKTNSVSSTGLGQNDTACIKTNSVSSTGLGQNDTACIKTNSVASLNSQEPGSGQDPGKAVVCPEKSVLGSGRGADRAVLEPQEQTTNNTLNRSSEDLFGEETSQQGEKKGNQIKTDQPNRQSGQKCMPSLVERLKHVTGPLDIRSKIKVETGYICCLCDEDATAPFKSACLHVCCFRCWKKVFEKDKLCPRCGLKVRKRHLQGLLFSNPDS
ncbi:regulator of telomere elongation helicase 1-like [Pecten maximus]|uniref:regulator of telomere elongation helicase 1-like n=1 Tax=Pecten maximus TaxID=6579 RepID=UPI001458CBB4|nr:regulator of telomere elongation helicase 1-like [Pecten maximus]